MNLPTALLSSSLLLALTSCHTPSASHFVPPAGTTWGAQESAPGGATSGEAAPQDPSAGPQGEWSTATQNPPPTRPKPKPGPWRLQDALGLPDWFELSYEQQSRYEGFDENFRASAEGEAHGFTVRHIVTATAHLSDSWRITGELLDGRILDASPDVRLTTGLVNTVNLLSAFVGHHSENVFAGGDELDVRVGRQTLDLGSRRFIARNGYRNTINAFTGGLADWQAESGERVVAFAFLPVNRLPGNGDQEGLRDEDIVADEERTDTVYYSLFGSRPVFEDRATLETYIYGLNEKDERDVNTRNRELYTVGARLVEKPKAGGWGYEWESAYQFGNSRASSSSDDTTSLQHSAQFHHLGVSYLFDNPLKLSIEGLFDFASGDQNPGDDENNRFDTLFGVPRGDFGPTNLFGAFGRENLLAPGFRIKFQPFDRTKVMVHHRWHYLASDRDSWVRGGFRDTTGAAGRFIGQLLEVRVRHDLYPKNLRLEAGVAHFFSGSFVEDADDENRAQDSNYVWVGFNWNI